MTSVQQIRQQLEKAEQAAEQASYKVQARQQLGFAQDAVLSWQQQQLIEWAAAVLQSKQEQTK